MKNNILLILGAGGHGKSIAESAISSGAWDRVVFADDQWPNVKMAFGYSVVCNIDNIESQFGKVEAGIAAVGDNKLRELWQEKIKISGIKLAIVIDPRAYVSKTANIGEGSVIMPLSSIGSYARVGCGCIVNSNSCIDHDTVLEDFVHLGVGVNLAGGVFIRKGVMLQAGCCIGPRIEVLGNS